MLGASCLADKFYQYAFFPADWGLTDQDPVMQRLSPSWMHLNLCATVIAPEVCRFCSLDCSSSDDPVVKGSRLIDFGLVGRVMAFLEESLADPDLYSQSRARR